MTSNGKRGDKRMVQGLAGDELLEILQALEIRRFRWSPDGTELLVSARAGLREEVTYLVPRFGGSPQQLPPTAYLAWSPDGRSYAHAYMNSRAIVIRDKSTGSATTLPVDGPFTWIQGLDWSSNGLLAIITYGEDQPYSIWTVLSGGGAPKKLLDESDTIQSLRWAGDGSTMYYTVRRSGLADLLKINVDRDTGSATSRPRAVWTGLETNHFSLSRDRNRLVISKSISRWNLWRVAIHDVPGDRRVETRALTPGTVHDLGAAVSPDGRHVAFVRAGNIMPCSLWDTPHLPVGSGNDPARPRGSPGWLHHAEKPTPG